MTSRQRVEHGTPAPQAPALRAARDGRRWGVWLVAAIVALAPFMFHPGLHRLVLAVSDHVNPSHLRAIIIEWGPWAPAASIGLMLIHTVLPFPAELLTAANGAIFGFWGGLLVSWVGAMAAAGVGFGIARSLGRPALARFVPERRLAPVDAIIGTAGWEIALVVRLIPVISFNLVNFALGLTRLSWPTFLWTTGVGILPAGVAAVAVGYGAARHLPVLPWALFALALLTVAGLTARRRLVSSQRR